MYFPASSTGFVCDSDAGAAAAGVTSEGEGLSVVLDADLYASEVIECFWSPLVLPAAVTMSECVDRELTCAESFF
jgi:hypothetical protein